jgi:hypothetical protein
MHFACPLIPSSLSPFSLILFSPLFFILR